MKMKISMRSTFLEKKNINQYGWISGVNSSECLLNFDFKGLGRGLDVIVFSGAAVGTLDHYVVFTKLGCFRKLVGRSDKVEEESVRRVSVLKQVSM